MGGSRDLKGVHGAINELDLERARLPDRPVPDLTSDKRRGAVAKDDVVKRVHGVCPPPMGMEREGTCE